MPRSRRRRETALRSTRRRMRASTSSRPMQSSAPLSTRAARKPSSSRAATITIALSGATPCSSRTAASAASSAYGRPSTTASKTACRNRPAAAATVAAALHHESGAAGATERLFDPSGFFRAGDDQNVHHAHLSLPLPPPFVHPSTVVGKAVAVTTDIDPRYHRRFRNVPKQNDTKIPQGRPPAGDRPRQPRSQSRRDRGRPARGRRRRRATGAAAGTAQRTVLLPARKRRRVRPRGADSRPQHAAHRRARRGAAAGRRRLLFERRTAGLYHNTAVVFDRSRAIAGKYRKMHIPDDPAFYEKFYFTRATSVSNRSTPRSAGSACWSAGTSGTRKARA